MTERMSQRFVEILGFTFENGEKQTYGLLTKVRHLEEALEQERSDAAALRERVLQAEGANQLLQERMARYEEEISNVCADADQAQERIRRLLDEREDTADIMRTIRKAGRVSARIYDRIVDWLG